MKYEKMTRNIPAVKIAWEEGMRFLRLFCAGEIGIRPKKVRIFRQNLPHELRVFPGVSILILFHMLYAEYRS